MDLVQSFKQKVAFYHPSTDRDTWQEFYNRCWSKDYSTSNTEMLKKVAYDCLGIRSGADSGMWEDRASRLDRFLASNIGIVGDDTVSSDTLQCEFIACFLNPYQHAAHNADLWQSFNDSAAAVLNQALPIPPQAQSSAADGVGGYAKWLLAGIPIILLNAFKTLNVSVYRPTEDTDTWAYFQNVVFDLNLLQNCSFTYRTAYLLNNISSGADRGIWDGFRAGIQGFLAGNLGQLPNNTAVQKSLAINFCNAFTFNYEHAAHNADLFKLYNDTFRNATTKLQALRP